MKKSVLFIISLFFFANVNAQLNSNASFMKNEVTNVYNEIKTLVSEDWEGDHSMMVYGINKQCDAFMELGEIMKNTNYDEKILGKALVDWGKTIKGVKCVDYTMVIYEYKKQIKAKSQY